MTRRGWRTVFDRHLVEGLTVDERIARLEGTVAWLSFRLDCAARRRRPFYRRWLDRLMEMF